jgi:hypothetical protein
MASAMERLSAAIEAQGLAPVVGAVWPGWMGRAGWPGWASRGDCREDLDRRADSAGRRGHVQKCSGVQYVVGGAGTCAGIVNANMVTDTARRRVGCVECV